jgi:hypothetical protein
LYTRMAAAYELVDTGDDPARPLVFLRGCDLLDDPPTESLADEPQDAGAKKRKPKKRRGGGGASPLEEVLSTDLATLTLPPANFKWEDALKLGIDAETFLFNRPWRGKLTYSLCKCMGVTCVELLKAGLTKRHVIDLGEPFGFWFEVLGASELFVDMLRFTREEWAEIGWNEEELYNYTGCKVMLNRSTDVVECKAVRR